MLNSKSVLYFFSAFLLMLNIKAALSVSQPETGQNNSSATFKSAVIFVRDNSGFLKSGDINTFSDMLSAQLSNDGFHVMDWKDVVQKFSESSYSDDQIYGFMKNVMTVITDTGTNLGVMKSVSASTHQNNELAEKTEHGTNANASALRIGQMLNVNYIIIASLGKISHEKRTFKGQNTIYKTNNSADIYTIPMILKVLNGNNGEAIYGDVITAKYKIMQNDNLSVEKDNILNPLLETGTSELADNISKKIDSIEKIDLNSKPANITVDCNVPGATVTVDGTAIGTTPGNFNITPGIHQMTVSRQYFENWEHTVNIFPGQKLNVQLEFTSEGQAKYKDLASFKQDLELNKMTTTAEVDIAKEQSKADANSKEKISSGQEQFLKNSYIRSDGFADQLTKIIHGY